jgi:hypothetical protein
VEKNEINANNETSEAVVIFGPLFPKKHSAVEKNQTNVTNMTLHPRTKVI